mmetsp:Transcript_20774/g.37832  ORF Transcript_20774/g.37832 Transcript_20774/m.37832 type:complete len:362 (-) Transcript_20774:67-1152(-)
MVGDSADALCVRRRSEPWLLRIPLPVAYRVLAFLARDDMAALLPCSPNIWHEWKEACWALCRPSVAHRRLERASAALQKWLDGVPLHVPPPRKAGQLCQVKTNLNESAVNCRTCEQAVRSSLHQGLQPVKRTTCQDAEAAALLRPLLSDESADVRCVAATCLGYLGSAVHDAALTALAKRVQEDTSQSVRHAAVVAMGELGPVAAPHAKAVAAALRDPCPHVSARAREALSSLGAKAAAQECVNLLRDGDRYVRARAVSVLGRLGHEAAAHAGAVSALLQNDDSLDVRMTAHSALMNMQIPRRGSRQGILLPPSDAALAIQASQWRLKHPLPCLGDIADRGRKQWRTFETEERVSKRCKWS